jgi:serine/threonine protein kinase
MSSDDPQRRVGPWTLEGRLGEGGNATVWLARRPESSEPAAVKVINTRRVDREPYQRFVREINFLREHGTIEGLLPLVDAYLPEEPTRADPPWLAMPVAVPLQQALANRPLADVVAAVATIADTLWRLARDLNVAHRDIKPGNLYELEGKWVIGDFGLVALPDREGLTREGKPLGPLHYTPYEMIINPAAADPHAADVYQLGKTLWVLATGQAFPPEGHQPAKTRSFQIGDYRTHPRVDVLDREIDLMTRLHAEERPSKEQVARDLKAWLELSDEAVAVDFAEARSRLRQKLEGELARQDRAQQRLDLAHAAIRRLQALTAPLNESLRDLSDRTRVDAMTDKMTDNLLQTRIQTAARIVFRWQRCTLVAPVEGFHPLTLKMGRSLELTEAGRLLLHLMVFVGEEGLMGGNTFMWRPDVKSAPVGTAELDKMLDEAIAELTDALQQGVAFLVDQLPESAD